MPATRARARADRECDCFSLASKEQGHRVDLAKAVQEARSGPGGVRAPVHGDDDCPSCPEGASGVVHASANAVVQGRSNQPPRRRWNRGDPGSAASVLLAEAAAVPIARRVQTVHGALGGPVRGGHGVRRQEAGDRAAGRPYHP